MLQITLLPIVALTISATSAAKNITRLQRSYYQYQTATSSANSNNVYLTDKYGQTIIKSAYDYYKGK